MFHQITLQKITGKIGKMFALTIPKNKLICKQLNSDWLVNFFPFRNKKTLPSYHILGNYF